MTKHRNAEMIKAKADNMDLVVFLNDGQEWVESGLRDMAYNPDLDFFLCMQKHKDACLHWLNGGLTEVKSRFTNNKWDECANPKQPQWSMGIGWTRSDAEYRIKPRKEKIQAAYNTEKGELYPVTAKLGTYLEDYMKDRGGDL